MKKPLVSFIIPCYNQTRFLYDAVSSIILSYTGPKEIIVVNDCSDESGWSFRLNELQNVYPQIKIQNNKINRGLSASRNIGINISKGDFIQFLDADDLLAPGKIDKQLIHFDLSKDLVISVTDYLLCDVTISSFYSDSSPIGKFELTLHDFLYKWERGLSIPIHCALFLKKTVENIRFFEALPAKEDWVFWCDQALKNNKIAFLNTIGAIYRQHSSAMTKANKTKMGQSWKIAVNIINDKVKHIEPDFIAESMNWYHLFYDKRSTIGKFFNNQRV